VVPLFGLLAHIEELFELGLLLEGRAVDPRQGVVFLVAAPVGRRDVEEFEGSDLARRLDVRATAEVFELGLLVEGNFVGVGGLALQDVEFVGVVALVFGDGLVAAVGRALDIVVFVDDLLHFVFNVLEVVLVEVDARDVVVKALVGPRTDGELGVVVEPQQRLGEDVGRRVPEDIEVLVALVGDDLDAVPVRDGGDFVDQLAFDLARDGVVAESRSDFVGHVL
jgi:hypothetical protein